MTQKDKDFMELHIGNYHTTTLGFTRNIEVQVLDGYEKIYQTYLDKGYYVTKWCSNCVLDMIRMLYTYYLNLPQEEIQNLPQPSKRGRPKRNENI